MNSFCFFTLQFFSRKDGGSNWMGRCVFRVRGEGICLACSKPAKLIFDHFPVFFFYLLQNLTAFIITTLGTVEQYEAAMRTL